MAWKLTLYTPEFPVTGREVVVIANDIAHRAGPPPLSFLCFSPFVDVVLLGTFGPQEDLLFNLASIYARQRRLPRMYISANSGARIGLADELRPKFKAAFVNNDPLKGLAYLFLSPADYDQMKDCVVATKVCFVLVVVC